MKFYLSNIAAHQWTALLLVTLSGMGCGTRVEAEGGGPSSLPVSKVFKEGTYWQLVEKEARRQVPDFSFSELEKMATVYGKLQKSSLGPVEHARILTQCMGKFQSNLLCRLFEGKQKRKSQREPASDQSAKASQGSSQQFRRWLKKGKFESIQEIYSDRSPRFFAGALSSVRRQSQVKQLMNRIQKSKVCVPEGLASLLGFRMEAHFPRQDAIQETIRWYEYHSQCASEGRYTDAIRFRLGLLYHWQDQCEKGEPHHRQLSEQVNGLYISRSYFWRARCAKKIGDKLAYRVFKNRVTKENPLGFHSAFLHYGRPNPVWLDLDRKDPNVLLRSSMRSQLNSDVLMAELFYSVGNFSQARRHLNQVKDELHLAEPEFALYISSLLYRNRDPVSSFRVLSRLFHRAPQFISRETMKMFFPLQYEWRMKQYRKRVSPILTAALIRQESAYKPDARSHAGALGLMQLMPSTARTMARVSRSQLLRPVTNISLGTKYLGRLLRRYRGDIELTLAAYNAGPHNVDKWKRRYPVSDRMLFLDLIPFRETRNYVALIGRNYFWYYHLYGVPGSATKRLTENKKRRGLASIRRPEKKFKKNSRKIHFTAFGSFE